VLAKADVGSAAEEERSCPLHWRLITIECRQFPLASTSNERSFRHTPVWHRRGAHFRRVGPTFIATPPPKTCLARGREWPDVLLSVGGGMKYFRVRSPEFRRSIRLARPNSPERGLRVLTPFLVALPPFPDIPDALRSGMSGLEGSTLTNHDRANPLNFLNYYVYGQGGQGGQGKIKDDIAFGDLDHPAGGNSARTAICNFPPRPPRPP
jgi:hypothetical protein